MNTVSNDTFDMKKLEEACQAIYKATLRLTYSADEVGKALQKFFKTYQDSLPTAFKADQDFLLTEQNIYMLPDGSPKPIKMIFEELGSQTQDISEPSNKKGSWGFYEQNVDNDENI